VIEIFKRLRWDWRDEIGRFNLLNAIWMRTPGTLGFVWRNRHVPRRFLAAGGGIVIHEGVRYRGVHKIRCGDRVEIGVGCFLQASGGLRLGDDVILGPGVKIWTVNHRFGDLRKPISGQGYDYEPVSIGRGCWLGADVFVMPGVDLPEGCVVAARSVVAKKAYPPFSILAGYPARVVGRRDVPETAAQAEVKSLMEAVGA